MANTLSTMVRNMVSKKRRRYTEGGYNLDLTYICPNIIAMGYPGENIQSVFRNPMGDVCQFFETKHNGHYKIYNLRSERAYDANKFHGRVSVYAFEDHNPPTIELILKFCIDVDRWLNADPRNVAAIHCKAGKGRTGTMICCYLLHSGHKATADEALAFYGEKRTMNKKGVTIPSQRRYVQYYDMLLRNNLKYERKTIQLCEIRFSAAPILQGSTVQCLISSMDQMDCTENRTSLVHDTDPTESWTKVRVKELNKFQIDFRKTFTLELYEHFVYVTGDVKIELKKIFHFWLNSYFVCDTAEYEGEGEDMKLIYTLPKCELDDAHKDKEHKLFPEDFKVQLVLRVADLFQNNISGSEITQLRQQNNHNNVNNLLHYLYKDVEAGDPTIDDYNRFNNKVERSRKQATSIQQQLPSPCSGGIAGGSNYVHANHVNVNNMVQQRNQQQQQPQKRSSEPMPSVNPESINRSNNKNHNNSSHYQQQQQQQQQQLQHAHHFHHQHQHLHHEQQQKLLQHQNHQLQSQQNNKCSTSSSNIHNTSSNSNSSSSSSISGQSTTSSSSAGVDGGGGDGGGVGEEEDWESGESSTTTTTTSTTTTTPTTTSYISFKPLISSQNDDDDDSSNKNVKHDDDDGSTGGTIKPPPCSSAVASITNTTITTATASVTRKDSEGKSLLVYTLEDDPVATNNSKMNPAVALIIPPSALLSTSSPLHHVTTLPYGCFTSNPPKRYFFHKKYNEQPCNENMSKAKVSSPKSTTTGEKFLKLINPPRFKAKTIGPGMGSSLALNTSAASVSPSTQNKLLLKKKKVKSKSQISPLKTFQWLQNYFQTDPDFHENLSQQTTIPMARRNSAGSISSRNHLNSVGSASGIGRAGSAEKAFYQGGLDSKYTPVDDDDVDLESHEARGAMRKSQKLRDYHEDSKYSRSVGEDEVDAHCSGGAVRKAQTLAEVHHENRRYSPSAEVVIKLSGLNKARNDLSLSYGTSPVEKALSNIVDIGTQLSSVSPAREKEFTYESDPDYSISQSNAAALLTKNTLNCDEKSPAEVATSLPQVALGKSSSPPSNERTISIGSSNNSNSMDRLCLPYSNMHVKPQSALDNVGDTEAYHDHDDFYSSLCDNQLSFNNSPCKSPRSLSDIHDLKPAITHKFRCSPSAKAIADAASFSVGSAVVASNGKSIPSRSDGIVIAKPVESHSIGFNVELTSTTATTNSTPSDTTEKYNMDVDCDDAIPPRPRKSPVDTTSLNLIIVNKSSGRPPVDDGGDGGGDVGDCDTDCRIVGDLNPNTPKNCGDGGSSSSSGYLCASEGSQSVSSTSIGVSSSGTAFSLERNSLDGGTSSGVELNSKKKLSLPTPEIEVNDFSLAKNRSSSVSNNNNHNNFCSFLTSSLSSSSSSSSSSSGSSIDNDKHL